MVVLVGASYKHVKGGIYEVLCLAQHTERDESLVVYKSQVGIIWARPLSQFTDGRFKEITDGSH